MNKVFFVSLLISSFIFSTGCSSIEIKTQGEDSSAIIKLNNHQQNLKFSQPEFSGYPIVNRYTSANGHQCVVYIKSHSHKKTCNIGGKWIHLKY